MRFRDYVFGNSRVCALRRNVLIVGVSRLLSMSFCISLPTIALFWTENDLSLGDIYVLQIWFAATWALCEIATGRFADRFGRALALQIAALFMLLGGVIYACGSEFGVFVAAELALALGLALMSGADEALLYDSLKEGQIEREFTGVWAKIQANGFWFQAVGGIGGGLLATFDARGPMYLVAALLALNFGLTFALTEPRHAQEDVILSNIAAIRKSLVVMLASSSRLRLLTLFPTLVLAFNQPALWMYTLYLKSGGIGVQYLGLVFAGFHVFAALSARIAAGINTARRGTLWMTIPMLAVAATYFAMGAYVGHWAWLLILPQQWARSFTRTVFADEINVSIPSAIRATALSVRNMMFQLWYLAAMIPCALWSDSLGIHRMAIVLGLTLLVVGSALLLGHRGTLSAHTAR